MTRIGQLIREAQYEAKLRNHNLRPLEAHFDGENTTYSAHCECGAPVYIDPHPKPNGIEISGEAVAMYCPLQPITI